MNEIGPNTTKWKLEETNYRILQQKAKSMNLPSNFKKIYLIDLIYTKLHGSQSDVDAIIQRVKWERQRLTGTKKSSKKTRVQADEITSTSIIKSPPISVTPRSTKIILRCNPMTSQSMIKYNLNTSNSRAKATIAKTHSTTSLTNSTTNVFPAKKVECERVLRNRSKLNPPEAYRDLINIDSNIVLNETEKRQNLRSLRICNRDPEPRRYSNNHNQSYLNVHNKCVIKHRPSILTANKDKPRASRSNQSMQLVTSSVLTPEKRKRLLSGIEPILPKPVKRTSYKYIQGGIGIRNRDGSYTEIKALVQKPQNAIISSTNTKMAIEYPIPAQNTVTQSNTINYVIETPPSITNFQSQEINDFYTTYASNNKIRAEHISRRRISTVAFRRQSVINVEETLPRIHEAFSMFGNVRPEVTQPLFVQVNPDTEKSSTVHESRPAQPPALSLLYNCSRSIRAWSHAPLLPLRSAAGTVCVDTALTRPTPRVQVPTTTVCNTQSHYSSEPSVGYSYDSYHDYLNLWEQDLSMREMALQQLNQTTSTNSSLALLASQVSAMAAMDSSGTVSLGAMTVTLPQSEIEDALELISQDGDYMDRIGMEDNTQCMFCAWAGPCLALEHHIRKDHSSDIHTFALCSWNMTLTLGALVRGSQARLVQRDDRLYVLTAVYRDRESTLCVQLSAISSEGADDAPAQRATITIYNKVSGEPHRWTGSVPSLASLAHLTPLAHLAHLYRPPTICDNYLQVELSKLDLLPNSANLKLINTRLVSESPGTVFCGQPELDDIHIIVFVDF